jgi:hypothetical protein
MVKFLRNEKMLKRRYLKLIEKAISSESDSGYERDTGTALSGSQVHILSRLQHPSNSGYVHPFTEDSSRPRIKKVPHINYSTHIISFLLFFMEVIQPLVAGTHKYWSQ